jgi:PIN domain nuclease of toxin-antitoxin system
LIQTGLLGGRITVVPFAEADALSLAKLKSKTHKLGLSMADHACLALGAKLHLPILTADKIWSKLNLGLTIKLIR